MYPKKSLPSLKMPKSTIVIHLFWEDWRHEGYGKEHNPSSIRKMLEDTGFPLYFGGKKKQKVLDFYERLSVFRTINPECRRHLLSAGGWWINVPDRLSSKFPVLANSTLFHILSSELCSCDKLEANRGGFWSCHSNQKNKSL